ncbi:nicotinate-nucleotide--dimethylbenzimidazole phosphoribosyltransferase [Paenactinomyces guangxiensis]|uniref:Nicotinate-nucleotide--dimethylbenzimidazole phosphoribosyltransferase n=1 Tax=Paenactinomyces guangxiensis TaxID=1490290 RepID=A0A7W2A5Y3_9BACL|nr:nicotinate-nucleotide--dimethylbenzimidazole phosphoribosyltransferase [Paenactinomyces guangxiensis]MBA4492796.1 nicotinate-nucleotide--dimethylbenzimidazole phosphoribosyltransferase [Paenactinomyces guangxiensis]MBH8590355.1 nicotinate-nucleotide--dimethylbenzimidazole phosphoribosyltransferase [Paenactinomyces guangxiensis]
MEKNIFPEIPAIDTKVQEETRKHLNQLTKPLGSLGQLEEMVIRLAGITSQKIPDVSKKAIVVMCADHGVAGEGVSAYPQEVTGLMIQNFIRGGAAINVLARQTAAEVCVVDVGSLLIDVPEGVMNRKIRAGTANFMNMPAMEKAEALKAAETGLGVVDTLKQEGVRLLAVGEMGIGNTTAGTAIAAVFTKMPVTELTGRGTGIQEESYRHKIHVIETALHKHQPDPGNPLEVLCKVGGLEIAGMVGCIIGAAAAQIPVVIDGLISTAAALIAVKMIPGVRSYLFASHLSAEPAHSILLEELGLRPIIDAEMRLGEASGAALSFPLFDAAVALSREMATFADLGLPGPE